MNEMNIDVDIDVPVSEVSTFQAQLVEALELNDKLIIEIKNRDSEISVFKDIKSALEKVIETQHDEIVSLKQQLETFKAQKHNERIEALATRWLKKYNMEPSKLPEVMVILNKFNDEDELQKMERLLEISSSSEKAQPVPVTQNSSVLLETFSESPGYDSLSPSEKVKVLHKQLSKLKNA